MEVRGVGIGWAIANYHWLVSVENLSFHAALKGMSTAGVFLSYSVINIFSAIGLAFMNIDDSKAKSRDEEQLANRNNIPMEVIEWLWSLPILSLES